MPTSSFFTDLVIDTPEAAANLEELIRSGVTWKRGDTVFKFADMDGELARRIEERYCRKQRSGRVPRIPSVRCRTRCNMLYSSHGLRA